MKILDTKKVRKVGNSKVMTLSNELLETLGVDDNGSITFILNDNNQIVLQSSEIPKDDFTEMMYDIEKDNHDVFKGLVDK